MIEGPRAVRAEELDAVVGLATSLFCRPGEPDMRASLPMLFNPQNIENLLIALEAGRPVALAGCLVRDLSLAGTKIRAGLVGAVCTLEAFRGQGIAGRLVEAVIARSAAQGAVAILVSGGRGLYRRMGCTDAGLWRIVRVEDSIALPLPACSVSEWTPGDIPEMVALHQAEPVRFERGAEEMRALLEARALYARPARAWVCRAGRRPVAYVCTMGPEQRSGERILKALEIAGSRSALIAGLPAILTATHAPAVEIEAMESDAEMASLVDSLGLPFTPRGFIGTVKIIDRSGFFAGIEGYIALRLTPEERRGLTIECGGPGVVFRYQDAELVISCDPDLAALVFGSVEREPPAAKDGILRGILARLFPLPLPGYGLNYI